MSENDKTVDQNLIQARKNSWMNSGNTPKILPKPLKKDKTAFINH